MTKRRADASPQHELPRKRLRSLTADAKLTSAQTPRRRKRPNSPEAPEAAPEDDSNKKRPETPPDPSQSASKRAREERATATEKSAEMADKKDDVDEDQLSAFNTFQFWRLPLPELDLSLLDEGNKGEDSAAKDSSEDMET